MRWTPGDRGNVEDMRGSSGFGMKAGGLESAECWYCCFSVGRRASTSSRSLDQVEVRPPTPSEPPAP